MTNEDFIKLCRFMYYRGAEDATKCIRDGSGDATKDTEPLIEMFEIAFADLHGEITNKV